MKLRTYTAAESRAARRQETMGEYHFCSGRTQIADRVGRAIEKVAKKHGAEFTWVRMPEGWRYWFSAPNRGEPFDREVRDAVVADLRAAGLAQHVGAE